MRRMVSIALLAYVVAVASADASAQVAVPAYPELIPYRSGDLWGFANPKGGLVTPCRYAYVDPIVVSPTGVVRVMIETPAGEKWGVVAGDGVEILPTMYDEVNVRDDGVILFRDGRNVGAAALSGRVIAPLGSSPPIAGRDGDLYWIDREEGDRGLFTAGGEPIELPIAAGESFRCSDGIVEFSTDDGPTGFGVVDRDSARVVRFSKYVAMYGFHADRALVAVSGGPTGRKYGFVDHTGKEVIPPRYTTADPDGFGDGSGLARVGVGGRTGLVDVDGKDVVSPRYDYVGRAVSGFRVVGVARRFGLLDSSGAETIPPKYASLGFWVSASLLDEGPIAPPSEVLLVASMNGKLGLVDASDTVRLPIDFDEIPPEPYLSYAYVRDLGVIWVRRGRLFGLLDRSGRVLVPPAYDDVRIDHELWESVGFRVELDGKWGLVSQFGKEIIPPQYDWMDGRADGGLIVVRSGRRYGAVSTTGRTVIPTVYDEVLRDANGFARVRSGRRYGFATALNGLFTGVVYEDGGSFAGGTAPMRRNGKWGLVSTRGEVLAPIYDAVEVASDDPEKARFYVVQGRRSGYVDAIGSPVTRLVFDRFPSNGHGAGEWYFRNGLACVAMAGRFGFIDLDGNIIVSPRYDRPAMFAFGSYAYVRTNGRGGFVDSGGHEFFDAPDGRD